MRGLLSDFGYVIVAGLIFGGVVLAWVAETWLRGKWQTWLVGVGMSAFILGFGMGCADING